MNADALITLVVVLGLVTALVRELVTPVAGMTGALLVLVVLGVVDGVTAFAGLANPATITIAALFVLARAVRETGVVDRLVATMLGAGNGDRRVLARMVAPVVGVSGFLNNTPIVATLAPMLREWATARSRPPSRFLMPLSFAAILGGMLTTIGTSTNLVVSGLLTQRGADGFSLFEVTPVGLPAAVLGGVVVVVLAPRVLPDRPSPRREFNAREYVFRMRVVPFGPLDGATVTEAGLRNLVGTYLAGIERGEHEIAPVAPDEVIVGGDTLMFVGAVDMVRDLETIVGLEHAEEEHMLGGSGHRFYEAIVGAGSPLAGRTLKDVGFRGHYGAAVVTVHRAGERVDAKLGSVRLAVGDVLLILADRDFAARWDDGRDFLLIAHVADRRDTPAWQSALVGASVLGVVGLAGAGVVPLLEAALGAVLVVMAARVLTVGQARDAVDLDVLLVIVAALGLGAAVETTGLAGEAAELVGNLAMETGYVVGLAVLLLATMALTEMISNTAAAALLLPVAVDVADVVGADPRGFAVGVAVMASASFLTPVGYQTNTMVYGLGGYRYGDYARLGAPVSLVVFLSCLVMVPLVWGTG